MAVITCLRSSLLMCLGCSSKPILPFMATSHLNFTGMRLPVVWSGDEPMCVAIALAGKNIEAPYCIFRRCKASLLSLSQYSSKKGNSP